MGRVIIVVVALLLIMYIVRSWREIRKAKIEHDTILEKEKMKYQHDMMQRDYDYIIAKENNNGKNTDKNSNKTLK